MKKCVPGSAILSFLLLAGCAATEVAPAEDFGERRQREWDELNTLKSQLRWHNDDPVVFTFPDHGEVTVRSWFLEGGPGWEYVRAEFTYENTTGAPMEKVNVELAVLGPDGETIAASRVPLRHPWGLPLMPGTFFSDEIRVPTQGAHLDVEGWHWTVQCKATFDEAFGRRIAVD